MVNYSVTAWLYSRCLLGNDMNLCYWEITQCLTSKANITFLCGYMGNKKKKLTLSNIYGILVWNCLTVLAIKFSVSLKIKFLLRYTMSAVYQRLPTFSKSHSTFICRTRPWKWSGYEPSKRRQLQTQWHNVTSQKTWLFSSTAVRTSRLKTFLSVALRRRMRECRYSCTPS